MGNENKWTPGPWYVGAPDDCYCIAEVGSRAVYPVAGRVYQNADSDEADAHLIAAAPELYEALDELADLMQGVIEGDYRPDSFTLQIARAALAKARGETNA